jgi:hypothetical protein
MNLVYTLFKPNTAGVIYAKPMLFAGILETIGGKGIRISATITKTNKPQTAHHHENLNPAPLRTGGDAGRFRLRLPAIQLHHLQPANQQPHSDAAEQSFLRAHRRLGAEPGGGALNSRSRRWPNKKAMRVAHG